MPDDHFDFQELMLYLAMNDIYISHSLIYYLLGYYFMEEAEYLNYNSKIQNLIKSIISISKPRFMIDFFMKGLNIAKINNPVDTIRKFLKVYTPVIKNDDDENPEEERHFTKINPNPADNLDESEYIEELYMSGIHFWVDIHEIAKKVDHSQSKKRKKAFIKKNLKKINTNLPSLVYFNSPGKHFNLILRSQEKMSYNHENRCKRNKNLPNKDQNQFYHCS